MKKPQFDLYLSLAMHGRLGRDVLKQVEEAKSLCKWYGVTYYSPCDDEIINPNKLIDTKPARERMRLYVAKDDAHIDVCRALLLLTADKNSSGTLWEAGRMHYLHRRPVLLVAPKMYCRQLANFSTIKAQGIFNDAKSAIKWYTNNKYKIQTIPKGDL